MTIKVTDEMIAAGVAEFKCHDDRVNSAEGTVESIFEVMWAAHIAAIRQARQTIEDQPTDWANRVRDIVEDKL